MSLSNKYYLTTTLPYVNAEPHIGFALEIVQADVLARFHHLSGDDVVFNTGTDEHGIKIYRKALENNQEPKEYCDEYAAKFEKLKNSLNLSYTNFIRTTDPSHIAAAQEFWRRCEKNGDIYKKNYQVKYCVGCEMEKTDSELTDNRCPIHPNLELENIQEENYFFRFSNYQNKLLNLYEKNPDFVVPSNRLEEIKNFVKSGLQDFSISRLKEKMPWGVPVPDDDAQVMYVWFDALVNYISTIGWPGDEKNFSAFWPGYQVAGKDNLRQQSSMWQAMLLSAGLPVSRQIFIHGFITSNGQKMSKSLGNVVNPFALTDEFGADATRYYLLGALPSYDDGDFSHEKFREFYNSALAHGIGNLSSRILTMLEKYAENRVPEKAENVFQTDLFWKNFEKALGEYRFDIAIQLIDSMVSKADELISSEKPWEKAKNGLPISTLLYQLAEVLRHIGLALGSIMPQTGEKILRALGTDYSDFNQARKWGWLETGTMTKKPEPLFPALDKKT